MKNHKFIIVLIAVAGVAIIAMLWVNRQQPTQQPLHSQQSVKTPGSVSALENHAAKDQKSTQALTESTEASRTAAAIEKKRPMDFLPEGSTIPPLKALETVEIEPNWDQAQAHPQLDEALLSDELKQKIKQSPVPVLLPEAPALLQQARIASGASWYNADMKEDGLIMAVRGNAKVVRVPDMPVGEPAPLGAHETEVSRSEGITEVNFKAFGIYYEVTVECYDHQNDPRCTEDQYILELVDALRLAQAKQ